MPNQPLVFREVYRPGAPSFFDSSLDELVCGRVAREGGIAGYCNVCSEPTWFACKSDNSREDLACGACGSINRHRQMVCALASLYFDDPARPLSEVCALLRQNQVPSYTAEANSALYRRLRHELGPVLLTGSEYFGPDRSSGDLGADGVMHQDLHCTSFADGQFSLVLTSEVFEHVPFVEKAEAEVMRILAPGGAYCFTVPFVPIAGDDIVLACQRPDGTIEHLAEPQYHGDPVRPSEGILVFRVFSDGGLRARFTALGGHYQTERFWSAQLGIVGDNGFTMTVRRPGPSPTGPGSVGPGSGA